MRGNKNQGTGEFRIFFDGRQSPQTKQTTVRDNVKVNILKYVSKAENSELNRELYP